MALTLEDPRAHPAAATILGVTPDMVALPLDEPESAKVLSRTPATDATPEAYAPLANVAATLAETVDALRDAPAPDATVPPPVAPNPATLEYPSAAPIFAKVLEPTDATLDEPSDDPDLANVLTPTDATDAALRAVAGFAKKLILVAATDACPIE